MNLIQAISGTLANVTAGPIPSVKPINTTVFVSADVFDTAQVQIYIAPMRGETETADKWFPVGSPIAATSFVTFAHRYAKLQAVVTNATANTSNLEVWVE